MPASDRGRRDARRGRPRAPVHRSGSASLYVSYCRRFVILESRHGKPRFVSGRRWSPPFSTRHTACPIPFPLQAGACCSWPTRRDADRPACRVPLAGGHLGGDAGPRPSRVSRWTASTARRSGSSLAAPSVQEVRAPEIPSRGLRHGLRISTSPGRTRRARSPRSSRRRRRRPASAATTSGYDVRA